jgi:predicted Zn-dependent peptidase
MFNNKVERFSPKYKVSYKKNDYRNWYSQYIRPENITLMIGGDVNYIYIKKLINEYFGNWVNNNPMPNRRVHNINITDKSGIDIRFTPFEDQTRARILILKKTTDLDQFWDPAAQMALYVFGYIGNSRKHKISQNLDKAGWIEIGWAQSNRMPHAYIAAGMEYSYLKKYYSELISEFNKLTNNSISKEELDLAKATRINDWRDKTYNPKEFNDFIQHYYNRNGYSLEKISNMITDINAVTIEEVNAAAKKIFDPNNFVMAITGNKDSCATFLSQFPNIEYYERAEEIRASASSP